VAKAKVRIKARVRAYDVVSEALVKAVQRGMNRCDKYSEKALTEGQRQLLEDQTVESFWLMMDDAGVELV